MNPSLHFKTTLIVATLLALSVGQSAAAMSKDEYKSGKTAISVTYKADKTSCDRLSANAKDVCVEEARARQKVALAEHEYAYTGKSADMTKVATTKATSAYEVAKERCDDLAGNPKDVCRKEAKAVEVKALADARMGMKIGEARTDAAQDKRDADYKVAAEKCDTLSGDAKASCVASAKTRFGKT